MGAAQNKTKSVCKIIRIRLENSEELFLQGCRLLLDAKKELELLEMREQEVSK